MSAKDNKALIRRYYQELYSVKGPEVIDEFFSKDYIHNIPDVTDGRLNLEEYKKRESNFINALSGFEKTIEDIVADKDKVVVRTIMRGKQTGDLPNIPASKKNVNVSSIIIYRIEDGKVVEAWENYDSLGMMMQLEVVNMISTLSKKPHVKDYYESMRTWPL